MTRTLARPLRWGALLALLAVTASACDGKDDQAAPREEPGVVHVHGLGINPEDGKLYAATHSGMFRIDGRGDAERVSRYYQDTMGFTVLGPDHFAGSGHPDLYDQALRREGRPPHLGLVESDDAGRTWEEVSLLGEVDFHALSYAHGRVYGYDATGQRFMVSSDRREWDTRAEGLALLDFAVSPSDPDRLVAGLDTGTSQSLDGGRTWKAVPHAPLLAFLDWTDDAGIVGVAPDGTVHTSKDGRMFNDRGTVGAAPAALLVTDDAWYAAVEDGGILRSDDGGASWTVFYEDQGVRDM